MTGPANSLQRDWPRSTVKAAHAIWTRLHATGREPRQFDELDQDTLDDLCVQAGEAVRAFLTETAIHVGYKI